MIHRSPLPDVSIPDLPLASFLMERAARHGGRPALVDGPTGRTISFAGWMEATRRCAAGLARRGMRKGDVLAIYSPNLPEYAVALHGVGLAGGIATTVNPLYTADELAHQLQDAGARFLVTIPPFLDKARAAAALTGVEEVFVFGEAQGATPFAALLGAPPEPPEVEIDPRHDVVVLPYSSGTTGLSKGVMLTHRNLVANLVQTEAWFGDVVGERDVVVAVLPFFHIYGMVVILNLSLCTGATVVTLPRFEMEGFLGTLQQYGVTFANVVPPIVLGLAKHPAVAGFDLKSLRVLFSGAAPLSAELQSAAAERLGCQVLQGYGLTETSPVTHSSPVDPERARMGSVGFCLPNTESIVADLSTGEPAGPGREGEICVRGPQVMKGYWNRPEATAAMIDERGWLHTGDIGYADSDGHFFVVDRVKELIKYKGFQVAPAELEALLLTHPAIADAAVIPSPDEEAGEVPKAFVVLKGEAGEAELMAWVAERVAPHKKLRALEVIDQIPKSLSGKILRRVLVERERSARNAG